MTPFIRLLLVALLFPLLSQAQTATNIRVRLDPTIRKMIIEYDLQNIQPADSLYIEVETSSGQMFTPRTITGAVGKGLRSGTNQAAYWDVIKDNARINEAVQARVRFIRPAPARAVQPAPTVQPTESPKSEVRAAPAKPVVTPSPGSVAKTKKSPIPLIGYLTTGALGLYGVTLYSSIGKDSDAYNSKPFVTSTTEKAEYDKKLSDLKSRKGTLTAVVGVAVAAGVATTIYTLTRKKKSSRVTLISPPSPQATNLGVAYSF